MAEPVRRTSLQSPVSLWHSHVATLLLVRDGLTLRMDPFSTPMGSAIIEPREYPPNSEQLPRFQLQTMSLPKLSPAASQTTTPARDLPRLQIPKPGQPIPGTMPSPIDQRPPLRTRRESHPFHHSPIFPKRTLKDTVRSYNQFWPYLVSPRKHTAHISESDHWDEKSLYRSYLYRNRYPTLLTLALLFLSLLPFTIFLILLFSCFDAGRHPGYNPQIRNYCNARNVLTALFPLSICVAACWGTIWAFRERVVVFWLSMSQDDYNWKYIYIQARKETVLLSWGAFEGPGLEDLHSQGTLAPQVKPAQADLAELGPKASKAKSALGTLDPSIHPGAVHVIHWSDPDDTIESGTSEDFLNHSEIRALYNITLPRAQAGQYPIHAPKGPLEGIELRELEPCQD